MVLALAAVGAVVVRIIHVGEGCSLKTGVLHEPQDTAGRLWMLMYKSYSTGVARLLDKSTKSAVIAADG